MPQIMNTKQPGSFSCLIHLLQGWREKTCQASKKKRTFWMETPLRKPAMIDCSNKQMLGTACPLKK